MGSESSDTPNKTLLQKYVENLWITGPATIVAFAIAYFGLGSISSEDLKNFLKNAANNSSKANGASMKIDKPNHASLNTENCEYLQAGSTMSTTVNKLQHRLPNTHISIHIETNWGPYDDDASIEDWIARGNAHILPNGKTVFQSAHPNKSWACAN